MITTGSARTSGAEGGGFISSFTSRLLGDIRGRAALVVVGGLVCQMGLSFGYLFAPLQIPITDDLGWNRTAYATGAAARIPLVALATAAIGFLTVRVGARVVASTACVIAAFTFFAMSRMQTLWHFYALMPLVGIVLASLGDVTIGHVVMRWVSKRRGLALGVVYIGANLGAMITVPLVAQLTATSGWRTAILWVGVGGACAILPFAAFAIRDPRRGERREVGRVELGMDPALDGASMDLRRAIRTRSFWLLGFNLVATFIYFVAMTDQLVPFLTDEGFSGSEAAGHFRTIVAMGLGSKILLGLLADRVTAPTALRFNTGLLFASSIVLLFLPARGPLALFIISYGFASTARDVLYPLIVVYCFGVKYMAEIYGVLMLSLVAGALGPIAAAAARDATGSYAGAFGGLVVLNGLSLAATWLIRAEGEPAPGDSAV
jgi:sugar phosphate permease